MSTTLANKSNMSQRTDSNVRASSSSITRDPGKGSKSIIPRILTAAAVPLAGENNYLAKQSGDEVISQDSGVIDTKTEKTMIQNDLNFNPGDMTPRNRVSSLPTPLTASRRQISKNGLNAHGSSSTKSKTGFNNVTTLPKKILENQFFTKKQKYMNLKKELLEKQKQVFELYDDVSDLREKLIATGVKDPGKIDKLIIQGKIEPSKQSATNFDGVFNGDQLPRCNVDSVVTSDFVDDLESKLKDIPNACLTLCQNALSKRSEIVSWLCDFSNESSSPPDPEMIKILETYRRDEGELTSLVENIVEKNNAAVKEIVGTISVLFSEHQSYKTHVKELEKFVEDKMRDLRDQLASNSEEFESERVMITQLKERKNAVEAQLQKAKSKIRELENHGAINESRIHQLQGHVKSLEGQLKQRETAFEAKTKDMNKSIKNSEILVAKTEKQRDSLESRVNDLKKKIDSKEAEFNERMKIVLKQLADTKNSLERETEAKLKAEAKVRELGERCSKLEEKSQQLCDLAEDRTKDLSVKSGDGRHTENEMQLWNDLQETRNLLAAKEDELLRIRQEKEKIISLLQEAADREDSGSIKDKLAADLVTKTEELRASNTEKEELKNGLKIAVQKSGNFERQLTELQSRLHAQSKEGGKAGWGAHAIELQQQLSDVRSTLAELRNQNEELETSLTQKQLELEQRDRIMREQSKVLKVRDELIALLKGQTQTTKQDSDAELTGLEHADLDPQMQFDPDTISRLVSKQIASKAEDLQTLYSNLESKQMQLMRLEKVVRQMEEDNDRCQSTRTKLEREVAHLRLQLHEKNRSENRYVSGIKRPAFVTDELNRESKEKICKNLSLPNSQSSVGFYYKPLSPIRSRVSSANSNDLLNKKNERLKFKKIEKTASGQRLRDIIRAVEIERARGSTKRTSRSLQRNHNDNYCLKNSTEIREDLYNWLVQDDFRDNRIKNEFVRHSRAILNRELSRDREQRSKKGTPIFYNFNQRSQGNSEFGSRRDCNIDNNNNNSCFLIKTSDSPVFKRSGKSKRS